MFGYGLFVLGKSAWVWAQGTVPDAVTMGAVAVLAFTANVAVAALLYAWRHGDANMRSVWLCSRNDALSNLAVLAAAGGVLGAGHGWPDWTVAGVMAALALSAGWTVMRLARQELRSPPA